MKNLMILSVATLITSLTTSAQDTILKRDPYKLTVVVDKNSFYEQQITATPYVLPDKTIQIYPGETIYVEVVQENGKVKRLTAVKQIKDTSNTVTISLSQSVNEKTPELTMLKVTNPFSSQLIYKAKIFLLTENKWANTDVLPVEARLAGFEAWPQVITSIVLSDLKIQKK
jgi:hypothetical protein